MSSSSEGERRKKSNKDGDDKSRKEKTSFQENLFGDDKVITDNTDLKREVVCLTSSSEDEGQRKVYNSRPKRQNAGVKRKMLYATSSSEGEGVGQRKSNNGDKARKMTTDKEKVPNTDYDKLKRQKKFEPTTSTSKKAEGSTRQPFVPCTNKRISMKTTPSILCCALQGLSDAQVSAIKDMGFQSILSMDIHTVPKRLGYWLLVNYDHKRCELNLGGSCIKITRSKVHELFGIPMGKKVIIEKNRPRQGPDPAVNQFRMQFKHGRISVKDVIEKLKANTDGGLHFKLNFLVIFNTILGEIFTKSTVNKKFLASIVSDTDICNMDWCSYMITCLNRTKKTWDAKHQYYGPLTLLAVLYTHECHLRDGKMQESTKTPAISYITTNHLNEMEKLLYDDATPQTESRNEDVHVETIHQDEGEREDENQHQNANLLDESVEILDPKHVSDSVAKFLSPQSDIICVEGYKVKKSNATIFEAIFKKHGDIAAICLFKTDSVRSSFLEVVCEVVRKIQIGNITEIGEDIECQVRDAEAANINVSWIRAHFEALHKRKESWILVQRAAEKDLTERSLELEAAQERFKTAERCVTVLRLVEKNLNDNIL